jgi:hypothetical protein
MKQIPTTCKNSYIHKYYQLSNAILIKTLYIHMNSSFPTQVSHLEPIMGYFDQYFDQYFPSNF